MKSGFSSFLISIPLLAQGIPPPAYAPSSVVHAANARAPALAPNTIATLYGKHLAWVTRTLTAEEISDGTLPTTLRSAGVRIYLDNVPAGLYYVSPEQINFLVPPSVRAGTVQVRVMRDGVVGPAVSLVLDEVSPALFQLDPEYVIAVRPDGSLVTPEAPAVAGEVVIFYASGLGPTRPPATGRIPTQAAPLERLRDFRLQVGDVSAEVLYAGVAPGFAGLYQINAIVPAQADPVPLVRAGFRDQLGPVGGVLPMKTANLPP